MPDWSQIGRLLDFCAAHYTTRLVRCAAFSFLLLGLVMLLRKMLFSRRTFIRGLLWSSFLLIPFLTVCQKQSRADMEDIYDRVCIQSSGRTAREYGMVLLKTRKLLSSESETAPSAQKYLYQGGSNYGNYRSEQL